MTYDFTELRAKIKETEERLARELSGIRTGRASPTLLDAVKIEAYGSRTKLRELTSVSVEDARTLRVIPWDIGLLKTIEKGIADADLGVGTAVDEQGLRISFPELTSERRAQLIKVAGDKTEQARVILRSHRIDAIKTLDVISKAGGIGEDEIMRLKLEIQKLIDVGNDALLKLLDKKEAEISQ